MSEGEYHERTHWDTVFFSEWLRRGRGPLGDLVEKVAEHLQSTPRQIEGGTWIEYKDPGSKGPVGKYEKEVKTPNGLTVKLIFELTKKTGRDAEGNEREYQTASFDIGIPGYALDTLDESQLEEIRKALKEITDPDALARTDAEIKYNNDGRPVLTFTELSVENPTLRKKLMEALTNLRLQLEKAR